MKQFLLYLTKIGVPVKTKFLVSIFLLGFFSINAQNSFNSGDGWGEGWGFGSAFSPSAGSSLIYTTTNSSGSGERFFRFYGNGLPCGQYGPETVSQQLMTDTPYNNSTLTCGNNTYAYSLNVSNTTDNYVFKSASVSAAKIVIFKIEGAIRTVSTVTQSPFPAEVTLCAPTHITATLDGALSPGQAVYMRYTKDSYATSTVLQLLPSGPTTYLGTIPSSINTYGANVSYYVFTSGTTAPSGADADLYTINLNNNGGSNYSYTVSGATTSIPDPNFEQALIDLDLDCAIDGKVLTSKISGVTELDIRDKNIDSLIGIKDFTSLTMLLCRNEDGDVDNDNTIIDLDLSGMTQLNYLYCENNNIENLNISGLDNLWELMISNNPLSTPILDLQGSPDLYFLFCENNGLTGINITGLTNLHDFGMLGNAIETLDLSANTNLNYLDCDDNAFTSINVTGLTNLQYFYCSNNQLESINVSGLSNLIEFYCNDNLLNSLDLRGLTSLDYFDCTANTLPMCILVDDVIAANTATTTEVLPSTDPKSYFWAKDVDADYSYCGCGLPPTTWNGATWNNGAPISTQEAIIYGVYNESAPISACNLTVKNGANVTIPSGTNITLNAPLTVETGGSFTLENNANLIQTNKNSINSGAITVKRNSNSLYRLDYTMWSSPVASQNLLAFSPLTTVTPDSRFFTYNSATNFYNSIIAPSSLAFEKGFGYLIRMPNTDPTSGYDAGTTPIAYSGVFTGLPNSGDIALAVTSGTYNAIGNPYPSTISADTFITDNNITEALYFWRKRNNENQAGAPTTSYATYTKAGGTGTTAANAGGGSSIVPNGTIQVGQGFIAKATSATLLFTNTMRTANNSNQIMKTKAIERNRVWVNLTNSAGAFSQMMVAYMSGATQDIDAAIDGRYFNDSQMALNSLINSEEFAIQGRALPFDGTDIVPLAFKTNLTGDYTISIDHVDGLFSGNQEVFLKDNNTGIETDLKAGAYTFNAAAGVDNARFSLKYQRTLGVNNTVFNDDSVTIHKNKGTLYVNSGAMTINNIKVFDIQGRLIAEQKNVKSNTSTIKDLKATQQVLIIKITSQDNKVVSKKIVN